MPYGSSRLRRFARSGLASLCLSCAPGLALAQSVKLNGPLPQPWGGDVSSYLVSPDGTRVVYRATQLDELRYELFSIPVDRSTPPVRLISSSAIRAAFIAGVS